MMLFSPIITLVWIRLLDTQDRVLGTEQEKHGDGCGVRCAPVPDAVYKETNTRKELLGAW